MTHLLSAAESVGVLLAPSATRPPPQHRAVGSFASFAEAAGLDRRLLKAVARCGFVYPTPVQAEALPLALAGKDLLLRSRTGSGKTAAYGLALLQKLLSRKLMGGGGAGGGAASGVGALILVPSRELCDQTAAALAQLAHYCNDVIRVVALGGGSHAEQCARLAEGPDVVVGTPGRVLAHIQAGTLPAAALRSTCDTLVVDEVRVGGRRPYGVRARLHAHVCALCALGYPPPLAPRPPPG